MCVHQISSSRTPFHATVAEDTALMAGVLTWTRNADRFGAENHPEQILHVSDNSMVMELLVAIVEKPCMGDNLSLAKESKFRISYVLHGIFLLQCNICFQKFGVRNSALPGRR